MKYGTKEYGMMEKREMNHMFGEMKGWWNRWNDRMGQVQGPSRAITSIQ